MAERIAVDEEHRYPALTDLLDREVGVRCDDALLATRQRHARDRHV